MAKIFYTAFFIFFSALHVFAAGIDTEKRNALNSYIQSSYDALKGDMDKPKYDVYRKAMIGYLKLKNEGKVKRDILTIIDFRISSKKKRMWTIDMESKKLLFHEFVAHGKNSGWDIPEKFSNTHNTNMSSLGFYLTGEEYVGKYGLSLRLDGMEKGFNSNARARAIVMHPAKYVNTSIPQTLGRMGRSFGCPAIPYKNSTQIVKAISNKSVFFIYADNANYHAKTTFHDELKAYTFLANSGLIVSTDVTTVQDLSKVLVEEKS